MKSTRICNCAGLVIFVLIVGVISTPLFYAQEAQMEKDINKQRSQELAYPVKINETLKIIGKGSFPHWSPAANSITFTDLVDGQYEIFVMKPDGTGMQCLTCGKEALREAGNRGQSHWHPGGQYIVFHAENKNLKRIGYGASARPGWGRNYNVWVMTADGERFWRLTDYAENWAIFETKFSHDGKKIVWGEEYSMEKYPNGKKGDQLMPWSKPSGPPYGHPGAYHTKEQFLYRKGGEMLEWRIVYADIEFDTHGPRMTNLRKINPPEGFTLNEVNGFTPHDDGFIGCYSDLKETKGLARWGEIYTCDLEGKITKRLTGTVYKHDEDPCYSPDGRTIAYKETYGVPGQGDEIFITDSNGGEKKQITHFSEKGYSEYDPLAEEDANRKKWGSAGTRITEMCFSPDGKAIVFGRCQARTYVLESSDKNNIKTLAEIPSWIYVIALE